MTLTNVNDNTFNLNACMTEAMIVYRRISLFLNLLLLAIAGPSLADPVEIRFNRIEVLGSPLNWKILDGWMYSVEYATEGRVRFITDPRSLGTPENQLSLVQSGEVDASYVFNGYLADTHPLIQISMMPMTSRSAEATAVALWRTYEAHFRDHEPFENVELMGFVAAPPAQIWSLTVEDIAKIEDFEGLKVHAPVGLSSQAANMLAAEPSTIDRAVFKKQVVDRRVSALFSGVAEAMTHRVLDDVTSLTYISGGVFTPTYSLFINRDVWESISREDQDIIAALSGEALARKSGLWDREEHAALVKAEEVGVQIVPANIMFEAELQDRWKQTLWDVWLENALESGAPGLQALDYFLIEVDRLSDDELAQ